jgi:hypothetical protein
MNCCQVGNRTYVHTYSLIIPQAKIANKVSKHVEWDGRKFKQKNVFACQYRGIYLGTIPIEI